MPILIVLLLLTLQRAHVSSPPHTPADVDLPRPHPREYPPVRRPAGRGARVPATQRGLFFTQDSQGLETVRQYQFGLVIDTAPAIPLAVTCVVQPIAQVFGCSALFTPKKGTHQYRIETRCDFCLQTVVRSDPVTYTQ